MPTRPITVIIPAAGLSTRYGGTRPKWALTLPNGSFVFEEVVKSLEYLKPSRIIMTVLGEHDTKFGLVQLIQKKCPNVEVTVITKETKGPAETVFQTILLN